MRFHFTIIFCLLLLFVYQSPQDTIRQHYEAAESARIAGNLEVAESEYTAILAEGYLRLGRVYSTRSEYARAITVLGAAQRYRPNSPEVLLALAIAYFEAERYELALIPARKAVDLSPNSAGAHQMLGKTYFMLGDLQKSISELESATKLAPNDIDVTYTLGIAYLRNRQPDAAKQLYNSLINTLGEQPQLHLVIGRAYRQSGLLRDAAEEFRKAIALDKDFPRAHYYLGITYLLDEGQKKIDEAIQEFKLEVTANPEDFFANYYLGVVYNFQRQWDLAIPSLRKASTIQPNNPDPYFQLGQAYQELNNHEQAIEALKKAIVLNPDLAHNKSQVATAHHRLAQSLTKTGQIEAGQKELQIAADLKAQSFKLEQQTQTGAPGMDASKLSELDNDPASAVRTPTYSRVNDLSETARQELQSSEAYYVKVIGTAHNNIGLLRGERQDFLAAAEQFWLAAKWDPQQEGLDYNLGLARYKSQSYKLAVPPLQNELKLHPGNRSAAMLLGMIFFRLGDYAKASELLSGEVNPRAPNIDSYYALASSLIKLRKLDQAELIIEQIRTTMSDAPQLHLLLAEKYSVSGGPSRALAELSEVLASNSNAPLVHYNAGVLYLKLGKRDEAVKEFEKLLAANPNDTQARYALADVFLAAGNVERGLALLREVVQTRPDDAEARYALGKAFLSKGDIAGAIENLERASKLDPETPEVHYQLGQAYISAGRKTDGKREIEISKQLRGGSQPTNDDK
jgi:tetratricopeptide (TPR) repeat protein